MQINFRYGTANYNVINLDQMTYSLEELEKINQLFPEVSKIPDKWPEAAEKYLELDMKKFKATREKANDISFDQPSNIKDLVANIDIKIGLYLHHREKQYEEALGYFQEALKLKESSLLDSVKILTYLGNLHETMGKYNISFEYYNTALEKVPDSNANYDNRLDIVSLHERLAATCENLYQISNDEDKPVVLLTNAIKHIEISLEICKELEQQSSLQEPQEEKLTIYAKIYNTAAGIYETIGQPQKALEDYEKTLDIRKKIYDEEHPDIASSLYRIGVVYHNLGQTEQALEYALQALKMRQGLYKDKGNHPDIANSLVSIGSIYNESKRPEQALEYHMQALTMRQELYKDENNGNHPDIASSLVDIGSVYKGLDRPEQALEYHTQALTMRRELYKDKNNGDHPDIADLLFSIGEIYNKPGTLIKAFKYHTQALTMRQELYKEINNGNHNKISDSLKSVGIIRENAGQLEMGLEFQYQSLQMQLYILGATIINSGIIPRDKFKDHDPSNSAYIHKSLILTCQKENILPTFLDHYKDSIAAVDLILVDLAHHFNNLGTSYLKILGQNQQALKCFDRALELYTASYATTHDMLHGDKIANHPDIVHILNNLGAIYEGLGQFSKALNYKVQALEMRRELKDDNDLEIAHSLNNIGEILLNKFNQSEKALMYFDKALCILQNLHINTNNGNHLDIAKILDNLATTYRNLEISSRSSEGSPKALELYKQAYFMHSKLLGKDHEETLKAKEKVVALDDKFSEIGDSRTNILERGLLDENTIAIKKLLNPEKFMTFNILDMISLKAIRGVWSDPSILFGDMGIKGYLEPKYLKKRLDKLGNEENVKIAQMLGFEAMCLGTMSNKYKNFSCIEEFVKVYPEITAQIIAEHPEYMIDGAIVKICTQDPSILTRLLGYNSGENFSGQGNSEYAEDNPWMEYTKEGMDQLLKLRLEAVDQRDVKTIMPNYVYDGSEESAQKLANEISNNLKDKALVVLNLSGKHWVGLVIKKSAEVIDIQYMDSEQGMMPPLLQEALISQVAQNFPQHNIQVAKTALELQKYNNCGPEVIENITSLLLGEERTTSQEDAVAIHSALLENSLMLPPYTSAYSISSHLLLDNIHD